MYSASRCTKHFLMEDCCHLQVSQTPCRQLLPGPWVWKITHVCSSFECGSLWSRCELLFLQVCAFWGWSILVTWKMRAEFSQLRSSLYTSSSGSGDFWPKRQWLGCVMSYVWNTGHYVRKVPLCSCACALARVRLHVCGLLFFWFASYCPEVCWDLQVKDFNSFTCSSVLFSNIETVRSGTHILFCFFFLVCCPLMQKSCTYIVLTTCAGFAWSQIFSDSGWNCFAFQNHLKSNHSPIRAAPVCFIFTSKWAKELVLPHKEEVKGGGDQKVGSSVSALWVPSPASPSSWFSKDKRSCSTSRLLSLPCPTLWETRAQTITKFLNTFSFNHLTSTYWI